MSDQYQIFIDREERRDAIRAALASANVYGQVRRADGSADMLLLKSEVEEIILKSKIGDPRR